MCSDSEKAGGHALNISQVVVMEVLHELHQLLEVLKRCHELCLVGAVVIADCLQ